MGEQRQPPNRRWEDLQAQVFRGGAPGPLPHQQLHELRRQPDFMPSVGGAMPRPPPLRLSGGPTTESPSDPANFAAAQLNRSFQNILQWLDMPCTRRYPSHESFEPFFRHWYERLYFPQASQKFQYELTRRAKAQGPLNGVVSQFRSWLLGNNDSFNSSVWYESHARSALPPVFQDCCGIRTATVNLGTCAHPCQVTFWGMDGRWFLPPWEFVDIDNISFFLDTADHNASVRPVTGVPQLSLPPQPGTSKPQHPALGMKAGRFGGA